MNSQPGTAALRQIAVSRTSDTSMGSSKISEQCIGTMKLIEDEEGEEDDLDKRAYYFAVFGALGINSGASWRQSFCTTIADVNNSMIVQVK